MPVARSHTTNVSRWLVMQIPATLRPRLSALSSAPRAVDFVDIEIKEAALRIEGTGTNYRKFYLERAEEINSQRAQHHAIFPMQPAPCNDHLDP